MTSPRKTVAISGGFDPIHIGHIRLIKEASKLGELVVILNNDNFLWEKKGYVFMPLQQRKEILENIKGVSKVVVAIDNDKTVCKTLGFLKPDIFANGGDVEEVLEAKVCRELGIKIMLDVGGEKIQSSSELVEDAL